MIPYLSLKDVTNMHADEINAAVKRVVDSGWYLQGCENQAFEREYAQYIGTKCCVGCANGLDALTLILRAYIELGVLSPGDEVIVPANTYIATILAITETGLVPRLVEPTIKTFQIDENQIVQSITPRTKAVMIVHLYGRCAYTHKISDICREYGLLLIEDNAQAHGCRFEEQRTGSLGHAAAHSFYPGKNLGALGDGGAVTTDDSLLAETVRTLANYGSQKKYVFKYKGRNSRLDEMQAAVLRAKLPFLDDDNRRREIIAKHYLEHIHNSKVILPESDRSESNVWHVFPILCEDRDLLQQHLHDYGVQTMIHYPIPPHKQECYKKWHSLSLPVTERIHAQELSLPISQAMTISDAEIIINAVNSF